MVSPWNRSGAEVLNFLNLVLITLRRHFRSSDGLANIRQLKVDDTSVSCAWLHEPGCCGCMHVPTLRGWRRQSTLSFAIIYGKILRCLLQTRSNTCLLGVRHIRTVLPHRLCGVYPTPVEEFLSFTTTAIAESLLYTFCVEAAYGIR